MNKTTLAAAGLTALAVAYAACNIHDNTINATANLPNASLDITSNVDLSNVKPAQSVSMSVDAQGLVLVEPADTPPPEHAADAVYLEFHLDVETNDALLVTAQTDVAVTIPADTPAGQHKIICRAHKHDDGTPTDVKFILSITVTVGVQHTDGGTNADAKPAKDGGAKDAGATDAKPADAAKDADHKPAKDAAAGAAPSTALF
jgi:hypothetical protein